MMAADFKDLRADESLDQSEDVGVCAALNLAQKPMLGLRDERQLIELRQTIRQELLVEIELSAANHVSIDFPSDSLRDFDDLCISVALRPGGSGGSHGAS